MHSVIQPSSSEQFERIFALRYRVLRAPWNQPRGSEKDDAEQSSIHAMIEDEAGNCIATGRLQFNGDSEAQIRYMAVDENHRGRKLGKLVLEFLERKAVETRRYKMVLQARQNAVNFYVANGYVVEEKSFLLFDSIQHYRMSKQLK